MFDLCVVDFCADEDIRISFHTLHMDTYIPWLMKLYFLPYIFLLAFQNQVTLSSEIDVWVPCFLSVDYMQIFDIIS